MSVHVRTCTYEYGIENWYGRLEKKKNGVKDLKRKNVSSLDTRACHFHIFTLSKWLILWFIIMTHNNDSIWLIDMSHASIEVEGYFRSNQFVPVQTGSKSKKSDFPSLIFTTKIFNFSVIFRKLVIFFGHFWPKMEIDFIFYQTLGVVIFNGNGCECVKKCHVFYLA